LRHHCSLVEPSVEAVCDFVGMAVASAGGIFGACLRDVRTLGSHIAIGRHKLGEGLEPKLDSSPLPHRRIEAAIPQGKLQQINQAMGRSAYISEES